MNSDEIDRLRAELEETKDKLERLTTRHSMLKRTLVLVLSSAEEKKDGPDMG